MGDRSSKNSRSGDADVLDDERDSDDDATEQIGRCNLPGRSRSNRIITAPARFYDYFSWELFDFGRLNRLNTAQ